jgi:hypothetical protein
MAADSWLPGRFWVGFFAPAEAPATVQALGRKSCISIYRVKERFISSGCSRGGMPEQFAERVRRDTEKYREMLDSECGAGLIDW